MGAALPIVAIGASVLGTGLGVLGTIQQTQAAAAQANYQAAVARNNQILAERQAQDAEARGKEAEMQKRREIAQLMGRQRATLAANGLVVDTGTPLDILADTGALGEYDALNIRANAAREAQGYRAQGANFGAQAGLYKAQASNYTAALPFAVGGTLLGGAGKVADKWYTFYGNNTLPDPGLGGYYPSYAGIS